LWSDRVGVFFNGAALTTAVSAVTAKRIFDSMMGRSVPRFVLGGVSG
jgi:hypothetical protein